MKRNHTMLKPEYLRRRMRENLYYAAKKSENPFVRIWAIEGLLYLSENRFPPKDGAREAALAVIHETDQIKEMLRELLERE